MKKVFIIAGVGDNTGYIESRTKNWSRKYNLEAIPLKFGWRGEYEKNYSKLKHTIVELSEGEQISLIGISAGGSAAIKLASELDTVSEVVTICARTSRGGFELLHLTSFPAYWESVDALKGLAIKQKVLVVRPLFDEIVSVKHTDYDGAQIIKTPYLLHVPAILMILNRQADVIADFINA